VGIGGALYPEPVARPLTTRPIVGTVDGMTTTTIHSQHFVLTASLRAFVEENLREPLERIWEGRGTSLEIFLRDVRGGDKQGLDKECRCVFSLPRGPPFVITEVTEDMRTSIHQARKRLLRRVRQYIGQKVRGARHARRRPA
jgi:ribosome-associated translation inhibitor RaiA